MKFTLLLPFGDSETMTSSVFLSVANKKLFFILIVWLVLSVQMAATTLIGCPVAASQALFCCAGALRCGGCCLAGGASLTAIGSYSAVVYFTITTVGFTPVA